MAGGARRGAARQANFCSYTQEKLFQRGGRVPTRCRRDQPSAPLRSGGWQSLLMGMCSFILISPPHHTHLFVGTFSLNPWHKPLLSLCFSPLASHTLFSSKIPVPARTDIPAAP